MSADCLYRPPSLALDYDNIRTMSNGGSLSPEDQYMDSEDSLDHIDDNESFVSNGSSLPIEEEPINGNEETNVEPLDEEAENFLKFIISMAEVIENEAEEENGNTNAKKRKDSKEDNSNVFKYYNFESLRINELFCDVTLVAGDVEFPVHKVVLAASSPYFKRLLEKTNVDSQKVSLDIDPIVLGIIISGIYSSNIDLSSKNVDKIFSAAKQLQVPIVLELCFKTIVSSISLANCLAMLQVADFFHFNAFKKVESFVHQHYEDLSKTQSFFKLTPNLLLKLVQSDGLVANEETVLYSVLNWVKHEDSRLKNLFSVLQCVRWPWISLETIQELLIEEDVIIASSECRNLLNEAIHQIEQEKHGKEDWASLNIRTNGRALKDLEKLIITCDGRYLNFFCMTKMCWLPSKQLQTVRHCLCFVVVNRLVYLIGGHDKSHLKTMDIYDLLTEKFTTGASMCYARSEFGATYYNGRIYVMGGTNNHYYHLHSVEYYDIAKDEWVLVAAMYRERSYLGVGIANNYLYVMGGKHACVYAESVERYRPDQNTWEIINVPYIMSKPVITELNGLLYVVADIEGICHLLCYDPTVEKFVSTTKMSFRHFCVRPTVCTVPGIFCIHSDGLLLQLDPVTKTFKTLSYREFH